MIKYSFTKNIDINFKKADNEGGRHVLNNRFNPNQCEKKNNPPLHKKANVLLFCIITITSADFVSCFITDYFRSRSIDSVRYVCYKIKKFNGTNTFAFRKAI